MSTKIFVLDDDEFMLKAISTTLRPLGDVTASALWSEMAPALLRAARDGGLVLLVCDLNMPGTSGIEFCKVVRRYVDSAAIIIFSGDLSVCEPAEIEAIDATPLSKEAGLPALAQLARRLIGQTGKQATVS